MIPIFPLPNVVLFPNIFLPLHIFEPRYREMVRDALTGDRTIGMVLLRDPVDTAPDRAPAVYPVGCAGVISHCEPLDDCRYNIVLRGLHKFRILEEDRSRSYRRARIEILAEPEAPDGLREARQRVERFLKCRLSVSGSVSTLPTEMTTATSSTRCRNISSSTRSKSRHCSSGTGSSNAVGHLVICSKCSH